MTDLLLLPPEETLVVGSFRAECVREDGSVRWSEDDFNAVCNLGFNLMLDSMFRSASMGSQTPAAPVPYWFIGLVSGSGTPTLAQADTMASHTGWSEDASSYTPVTFAGAVNNSGGYSTSATTMAISGVSQAIPAGTPFTVVGASGTYTVLSSVGGSTPTSITFTPGLAASVSNSAVITFNNGRIPWVPTAAASKAITNTSSANFSINGSVPGGGVVIYGIFVTSDPTLSGTAGLMWAAGAFTAPQTLFSGDTLKITYTVTLS